MSPLAATPLSPASANRNGSKRTPRDASATAAGSIRRGDRPRPPMRHHGKDGITSKTRRQGPRQPSVCIQPYLARPSAAASGASHARSAASRPLAVHLVLVVRGGLTSTDDAAIVGAGSVGIRDDHTESGERETPAGKTPDGGFLYSRRGADGAIQLHPDRRAAARRSSRSGTLEAPAGTTPGGGLLRSQIDQNPENRPAQAAAGTAPAESACPPRLPSRDPSSGSEDGRRTNVIARATEYGSVDDNLENRPTQAPSRHSAADRAFLRCARKGRIIHCLEGPLPCRPSSPRRSSRPAGTLPL